MTKVRCRSCGKEIVFLRTKKNRMIPVDADSLPPGINTDIFDHKRMVSHFATCPQANKWRNKNESKFRKNL